MTNQKYLAKINDQFEVALEQSDALPFRQSSHNIIHAIDNSSSVNAEICAEDFLSKKYTIKINSSFYEISLLNELDMLIKEMGLGDAGSSVQNELIAPMPGLIVEILAQPGDKVQTGDPLLVLEAMKMENTLTAPGNGIIKSIHVKVSDAVDKGMVLIEFEKDEENQ